MYIIETTIIKFKIQVSSIYINVLISPIAGE